MKPASFEYCRPESRAETLTLLAEHGDEGKVLAGGQSLVPSMNFRLARPSVLIDINRVADLAGVAEAGNQLVIGTTTRHAAFEQPCCPGPLGRLLADVAHNIAHYPIRRRGTFGGSLAHADPASEWCLTATTLDAEMEIAGTGGTRRVAASEFFHGSFVTAVSAKELLTAVRLPLLGADWSSGFYEFSRRKGDFALAASLVALRVEAGRIAEARVGVGALGPHPVRLAPIEAALLGLDPAAVPVAEIAAAATGLVDPSGDIHGSADYRRDLAATVVKRALSAALSRVTG